MDADVDIRPLVADDLPAYKALRDEMLALHPEAFTSDAPTERARPASAYLPRLGADRSEGGQFTLGAWLGERLVGAISCERDMRLKVRHIVHVVGMMVRPEARGRGIGRGLVEALIAEVRRTGGIELVTLTVTSSNGAATSLYEAAGFTRYGKLVRAIKLGDTCFDKDLMSLAL